MRRLLPASPRKGPRERAQLSRTPDERQLTIADADREDLVEPPRRRLRT